MQSAKPEKQASELSYHGPLIGMRSTRPQNTTVDANTKKAPASERSY